MASMFSGANAFNQTLASWDIGSVTNMTAMLDNCGMSLANYENTLEGWAVYDDQTEGEPQVYVSLGAEGLTHCASGGDWKNLLSSQYGWSIIDGGEDPNCL